jgi:hypothetical protein
VQRSIRVKFAAKMSNPTLHGTLRATKGRAPAAGKPAGGQPVASAGGVRKEAGATLEPRAPLVPRQEMYERLVMYAAKGETKLSEGERKVMEHIEVRSVGSSRPGPAVVSAPRVAFNRRVLPPFACYLPHTGKLHHPS